LTEIWWTRTGVAIQASPEGEASLPEEGPKQPSESEGVMDQTGASWNPLVSWLRQVQTLMAAA